MSALLLLALFSTSTSSCGGAGEELATGADGAIAFRTIERGSVPASGTGAAPTGRILCAPREARRALAVWGLDDAGTRLVSVDFTESCLLAVLAGEEPSTGYRLRVLAVLTRGRQAIVTATVRRPAGIVDGMAISRPYALLTADRNALLPLRHKVIVRARE